MKQIFNTLKLKWTEYILEILVLIVGIYGAFALESWNEDSKRKEEEVIVLSEILSSLKRAHSTTIAMNNQYEIGRVNLLYVDNQLDKVYHSTDSMKQAFRHFYTWYYPRYNYSAFEHLKSKGLDIISNTRIRSEIITVYDEHLFYLLNEIDRSVRDYLMSVGIPVVSKYILVGDKEKFTLADYNNLKDNIEFLNVLRSSIVLKKLGVDATQDTILFIEQLIVEIEREIPLLRD